MRFIIVLLIFSSCISEKKINQLCIDKYIIKDSVIYIERQDTIYEYLKADTIYFWNNKYIQDTITIKKIKSINKYIDKIVYRENTAKIDLLEKEKQELIQDKNNITNLMTKINEQLKVYKLFRNLIVAIALLSLFFYIYLKTISKKWL